jgi:DNA polymerase-3 subunit delta'
MHPWSEPILESLKARLESLPHALLIHGPRGVGKLALAERFAQLLLCEAADAKRRPCGNCEGCRWYLGGNHPDFRRVEPEALSQQPAEAEGEEGAAPAKKGKPSQEIKVDQVRGLADFLNIGSHRGRRRVALVHPAEEMNANAANALLKGLEEPPAGAMFILVAHRPARLLPTIRSRCVAVPAPVPSKDVALKWLMQQQAKEAERWLAYAGGAPVKALEYATSPDNVERVVAASVQAGAAALPEDREHLEALAEALQKLALDRALSAFGLPPKYSVSQAPVAAAKAKAWLTFARQMGPNRALTRHPLNPRLFGAEMLGKQPSK